jgi:hypothetical protein
MPRYRLRYEITRDDAFEEYSIPAEVLKTALAGFEELEVIKMDNSPSGFAAADEGIIFAFLVDAASRYAAVSIGVAAIESIADYLPDEAEVDVEAIDA